MKTAILYDSKTGNTAFLAHALAKSLPNVSVYTPDCCNTIEADRIFVGFWTDKGTCSQSLQAVFPLLAGKEIFLFGTAGFGTQSWYFEQIIERIKQILPSSCHVIGWYMCPGRMRAEVRQRYEAMCADPETQEKGQQLLENFDFVANRPNDSDIAALLSQVSKL